MSAPSLPGCESSLGPACLPISHFSITVTVGLVFRSLLFYLTKAPKSKSRNAGNSDMPKKSLEVFPSSEKLKVLDLMRKEKYHMLRLIRSVVRMNPL